MKYRMLGRSGVAVSPLCLGTMLFGGATPEAEAARIIGMARDGGVNFIDTADAYNDGETEHAVLQDPLSSDGGLRPPNTASSKYLRKQSTST